MEAIKLENLQSEVLAVEVWELRQARLHRERALKRLRRFAFKAVRVYPWVAGVFAFQVARECGRALWVAIFSEPELFMHEEPGKQPLRRAEWEQHYLKSPKIF